MGINDIGKMRDTADVELVHPSTGDILKNEDGSPMTITVHGIYSARYKSLSHAQQNKRLLKAQRTGGRTTMSAEEIEASGLDLLVRCVEGWNVTLSGSEPEAFSHDKVREVFTDHPWVREQVEMVHADTRAFLDSSGRN